MLSRNVCLLALAAVLGCATSGASGPPRSRSLITSKEVAASRATTAYGVVEQLRPLWVRSHGATSINAPGSQYATVYVNEQRYGDLTSLRNIPSEQVVEIRYFSAAESVTRFGPGNSGGVIEVKMR